MSRMRGGGSCRSAGRNKKQSPGTKWRALFEAWTAPELRGRVTHRGAGPGPEPLLRVDDPGVDRPSAVLVRPAEVEVGVVAVHHIEQVIEHEVEGTDLPAGRRGRNVLGVSDAGRLVGDHAGKEPVVAA